LDRRILPLHDGISGIDATAKILTDPAFRFFPSFIDNPDRSGCLHDRFRGEFGKMGCA